MNSSVHSLPSLEREFVLLPNEPYAVAFRPKFHQVSIFYESEFLLIDSRTQNRLHRFPVGFPPDIYFTTSVFSSTGDRLLAANESEGRVFDLRTPERLELPGHDGGVSDLCFSPPDGKEVATCGVDGYVRLWDTLSGRLLWKKPHQETRRPIQNLCFSPDGESVSYTHLTLPTIYSV